MGDMERLGGWSIRGRRSLEVVPCMQPPTHCHFQSILQHESYEHFMKTTQNNRKSLPNHLLIHLWRTRPKHGLQCPIPFSPRLTPSLPYAQYKETDIEFLWTMLQHPSKKHPIRRQTAWSNSWLGSWLRPTESWLHQSELRLCPSESRLHLSESRLHPSIMYQRHVASGHQLPLPKLDIVGALHGHGETVNVYDELCNISVKGSASPLLLHGLI